MLSGVADDDRPQLFRVPVAQDSSAEGNCAGELRYVVTVDRAVASELRESEIMGFDGEELEAIETARTYFHQALGIPIRKGRNADVLEVQVMLRRETGCGTGYFLKRRVCVMGYDFEVVKVAGRPRHVVVEGSNEAAQTMDIDRAG